MKHKFIYLFILVFFAACSKEDVDPGVDTTELNNQVTTCQYAPYTTGSTFVYEQSLNGSTTTATWTVGNSQMINGKQFVEISGFLGTNGNNSSFFNCENGEYTVYDNNVPTLNGALELIYMKENVSPNTTWTETISQSANGINYNTKYEFTYVSLDATRMVNGITYNNVIHIHLDSSTNPFGYYTPFSSDDYYWAEGVGLIEYIGSFSEMKLVSYDIQ